MGSSSRHVPTASDFEAAESLDATDRRLLDEFQREFPLLERPYAKIAAQLGCTESEALARLSKLSEHGFVSRVGAVITPHTVGYSVLAALAVAHDRIDDVAEFVNGFEEVNHNYEREHSYNLWFVVAASDAAHADRVIDRIELETGLEALRLPLERAYHIDLGFPLWS